MNISGEVLLAILGNIIAVMVIWHKVESRITLLETTFKLICPFCDNNKVVDRRAEER